MCMIQKCCNFACEVKRVVLYARTLYLYYTKNGSDGSDYKIWTSLILCSAWQTTSMLCC